MDMNKRIRYLFEQYYHNRATRQELEEFFAIIHSAAHDTQLAVLMEKIYQEIRTAHPSNTYIDQQGNIIFPKPSGHGNRKARSGSNIKPLTVVAYAAAILVLVSLSVWFLGRTGRPAGTVGEHIAKFADKDENKYLILSDSTRVWLNSSSKLEYPEQFEGSSREVYLTGEAFFDVKNAAKMPFIIHTGDVRTTVLGTEFNIKAYPDMDEVVVAVKQGKVSISRKNEVLATLVKNQELTVNTRLSATQAEERILNTKIAGSWIEGYLDFEDEPMGAIVKDLERVYSVQIELADDSLRDELITISFRRDAGAANVLDILCRLTDKQLTKNNHTFIIH